MGLQDGTRIGAGGALFGIGFAGTLALLIYASEVARSDTGGSVWADIWFLAFFAFAIAVGSLGVYLLAAVWFGWPTWTTAIERAFQPQLVDTTAVAHRLVHPNFVVVKIGTYNAGRGNVEDALVNVLVPDFITDIQRCDERGGIGHPLHMTIPGTHTSEGLIPYQPSVGSIYWDGRVSFPGRIALIAYFLLAMPGMRHDFPLRLKITAPELQEPVEQDFPHRRYGAAHRAAAEQRRSQDRVPRARAQPAHDRARPEGPPADPGRDPPLRRQRSRLSRPRDP